MKIGVIQMNCFVGKIEANISRILLYTEKAKKKGCEIIVFPEMVDTGYEMKTIKAKASTWDEKPFYAVKQAALNNEIYIICNISEKEDKKIYNSTAVINPKGKLIGKYRKIHLADYPPLNEASAITPGKSMEIIKINGLNFGLMTCYDLRFPEMSRKLVLDGAQVLVLCSAWPFPRLRHWNTLISARAIENQVYFIGANRVGIDAAVTYCGSSRIVDPYGVIVSSASENDETLITGDILESTIKKVRKSMPVFKHRTELDKQPLC